MANGNNADRSDWYIPDIYLDVEHTPPHTPPQPFDEDVTVSSSTVGVGAGIGGFVPVHLRGQYSNLNLENPDWALEKEAIEGTFSLNPSQLLKNIFPDFLTLDRVWVTGGRGGIEYTDHEGNVHTSEDMTKGGGLWMLINNLRLAGEYQKTGDPDAPDTAITASGSLPFWGGELHADFQKRGDDTGGYLGWRASFKEGGIASDDKEGYASGGFVVKPLYDRTP
jgi:hypothetical protein